MAIDPVKVLAEGNALLSAVLTPAGFSLGPTKNVDGSGGAAAVAVWTKRRQSIELHMRYGLGIVDYGWGWGRKKFSHRHLCDALSCEHEYPGFSTDPLDAFRHLAADLARDPLNRVLGPDHRKVRKAARAWKPPKRVLP